MFPFGFWDSELWKYAARAGLRQISRLVNSGDLGAASRLATTPGVLKPSAAGSQIRTLGSGAEGVASLVAHPQHGVAVRKLYNPMGLSTPQMIQRKEMVGQAVGANLNIAQFYGSTPTPHGEGTMHFSEYVDPRGPHAAPTGQAQQAAVDATRKGAIKGIAGTRMGYSGAQDLRKDNMVWSGNEGRYKAVDYLPERRGEFAQLSPDKTQLRDMRAHESVPVPNKGGDPRRFISSTSQGSSTLLNSNPAVADKGELESRFLGGKNTPITLNVGDMKSIGGTSSVPAPGAATAVATPTGTGGAATAIGSARRPPSHMGEGIVPRAPSITPKAVSGVMSGPTASAKPPVPEATSALRKVVKPIKPIG